MAVEQAEPRMERRSALRRLGNRLGRFLRRLVGRVETTAAQTAEGPGGRTAPEGMEGRRRNRAADLDAAADRTDDTHAPAHEGGDGLPRTAFAKAPFARAARGEDAARSIRTRIFPPHRRRLSTPDRKTWPSKPLQSRFVQVEDLSLHAMERPGKTDDLAVVLVHGAGLDHRDWTFGFIDRIAPTWRILAFDRPGFGGSERPTLGGALPATQARLMRAAIKAMGVERAVLVGHSWGGAVVTAWALDAPETVSGVVSLAGAVMPWSLNTSMAHSRRIRSAAAAAFRPGGLRQAALDGIVESFSPEAIPDGYVEHVQTDMSPLSGPAVAMAADVATVSGALSMQKQRYADFAPPLELVYGDQDAIVSVDEQGRAVQKLVDHASLTVVAGAGHMVHHTHPDDCLRAIEKIARRA